MSRLRWAPFGVLMTLSAFGTASAQEVVKPRAAEEQELRAAVETLVQAFAKGDAKAVAAAFTEDGEAIDPDGQTIQGRAALETHYASRFAEGTSEKVTHEIDSIKVLAPGVARVKGKTEVTPPGGGTAHVGRYSALHVKRGRQWLIASLRDLPEEEVSHYEHLKELEWMVGDWVEESADSVVTTSVAWSDSKNFLLRSFEVRVHGKATLSGTQRIGWDPLTKQIKSWVFDSHGGHGEGAWSRRGDQWAIKAWGVRNDGQIATATQVLTYLNKDTLRWKSFDRTLGGAIESDMDEIVMVRKPPQPK